MSEIIIDHEAAKLTAEQAINIDAIAGGHVNLRHLNLSRAYLDMVAQRDYWRTLYTGGVGELPLENEQKGGKA